MIAFVCAMPMELRPLRRRLRLHKSELGYTGRIGDRAVIAVVTGIGTARAHAATLRLLDEVEVERVVVVGIAGAIDNTTPIGALIEPEQVVDSSDGTEHRPAPLGHSGARGTLWTTDELILDPVAHGDLRARGVIALDMETATIAAVCEKRSVPWSVVRAISDRAGDGSVDAAIFGLSNPDGTPNLLAVLRWIGRHPGSLLRLIRLARGSRLATERAAEAAVRAVRRTVG